MMNQIFTLLNVRIKNNLLQRYKNSNPDNMWIVSVFPLIKQGSNNIKVINLTAEKYPIIAPLESLWIKVLGKCKNIATSTTSLSKMYSSECKI